MDVRGYSMAKFSSPGWEEVCSWTAAGALLTSCGDVEQDPGPLRIVTLNTTSLPAHFEAVVALPADVISLQETPFGGSGAALNGLSAFITRLAGLLGKATTIDCWAAVDVHLERLGWRGWGACPHWISSQVGCAGVACPLYTLGHWPMVSRGSGIRSRTAHFAPDECVRV